MHKLNELYQRIGYLRSQGVKMKEIAEWADMAPSVISSLYTTVLPHYLEAMQNNTPEDALEQALGMVNNISKKKLLHNLSGVLNRLNELEPDEKNMSQESTFFDRLKEDMVRSIDKVNDIQDVYYSYSLSSSTDSLKVEPMLIMAGENNNSIQVIRINAYGEMHWGNGIISQQNFYCMFSEYKEPQLSLVTMFLTIPMLRNPGQIRGLYTALDYNHNPVARRILLVRAHDEANPDYLTTLFYGLKDTDELTTDEQDYYTYTCQPGDYIKMCHVPSPQLNANDLVKEKKMLAL